MRGATIVFLVTAAGCGKDLRAAGEECVASSQCQAGLVCDFGQTPHVCADMTTDPPDAGPVPIDGPPIDADPTAPDANPDPPPDAYPACAVDLAPADDGSGAARQALVIAEIDPGAFIEVHNNTGADMDLDGVAYRLVSGLEVVTVASVGAGVTVHAGGRAELGWPGGFTADDLGGEVLLYLDADTATDANIMGFVCWGATPTDSRKANAEAGGKWTADGLCPLALVGGAIHRLPGTDGLDAADFDVTSGPSPETCE
jgi:hypothetical protein